MPICLLRKTKKIKLHRYGKSLTRNHIFFFCFKKINKQSIKNKCKVKRLKKKDNMIFFVINLKVFFSDKKETVLERNKIVVTRTHTHTNNRKDA